MIRMTIFAASAAIILAGCTTMPEIQNGGKNIALGQAAIVDGPTIRPLRVLEDSRCPINARCIRAGDVRLLVEVLHSVQNRTVEISLKNPVHIADGHLTLTRVTPNRGLSSSSPGPKPEDYRFSFKFDGGF